MLKNSLLGYLEVLGHCFEYIRGPGMLWPAILHVVSGAFGLVERSVSRCWRVTAAMQQSTVLLSSA